MLLVVQKVNSPYKFLLLILNGKDNDLAGIHSRHLGQDRDAKAKSYILQCGIALPDLKYDVWNNIPLGKKSVHIGPNITPVLQHDLRLIGKIQKGDRVERGPADGLPAPPNRAAGG